MKLHIHVLYVAICLAAFTQVNSGEKPNVIIVMTDDQGYGELSIHGNPILKTPHLDQLARRSQRFSAFHVAPMCTPTRGQLLTGLDAVRNGAINVSSGRSLLRSELKTMADYFAENGYQTGVFGKWHLGSNYPYRPTDRGFHKAIWFPSSHIGSVPDHWGNDYFDDVYLDGTQPRQFKGYCTDIFFDEAMAFMRDSAKAKRPFLTYVATNTPHGPLRAKPEDKEALAQIMKASEKAYPKGKIKVLSEYLGMVRNIDTNMGRLADFLEEEGIAENTIVIFTTDNGSILGPTYFNAGMRGMKTQIWEGGHRVPLFISWPDGGFPASREIDGLTQVQDLLPTLIELCGLEVGSPEFDGISLADVLRGKADVDAERMLVIAYSRMPGHTPYPALGGQTEIRPNNTIVLYQNWRLLENRALNDLKMDPLQKEDVIKAHPQIAEKMRAHLMQWWSQVKMVANEPQRVVIGHDAENPSRLTACDWLDVFVDQQRQVRGSAKKYGYWLLDVAQAGEYEFELRRLPRGVPVGSSKGLTKAYFYISGVHHGPLVEDPTYGFRGKTKRVTDGVSATFTVSLEAGPISLHGWFNNGMSAYYVYVTRK